MLDSVSSDSGLVVTPGRSRRGGDRSCEPRTPVPFSEIVGYIRRNLSRRVTLGEVAAVAHVSVFQLTRAFQREAQASPYRVILDLRIEHAKRLMRDGASIADAACCTGFADQSHFTRHFKRRTGVTPKQYIAVARVQA